MRTKKKIDESSEHKIIEAARNVFHRRGFDGARMQDIADEAGMNKALLHYYYRNKDQLFEAVFREAILKVFPRMFFIIESDLPLEEKIERFIHTYIDHVRTNPYLPGFVIHEISNNPERLKKFLSSQHIQRPEKFFGQIKQGIAEGRYRPIDPGQFFVSLAAQCVFPFVARPVLQIVFQLDDAGFDRFIEQRKQQLTELILKGLHI